MADVSNNPICQCPPNYVGDPYNAGCQLEGFCNNNKECPVHSICQNNRCINPCENACGRNSICDIVNGEPICKCMHKFIPSEKGIQDGCVRSSIECTIDSECDDSVCLDGQCRGTLK